MLYKFSLENIAKVVTIITAIVGIITSNIKISEVSGYQIAKRFEAALEDSISVVEFNRIASPSSPSFLEYITEEPVILLDKFITKSFSYKFDEKFHYKVFDNFYGLGRIKFIKTLSKDDSLRSLFNERYLRTDIEFGDISIKDNIITLDNSTITLYNNRKFITYEMPIIKLEVKNSLFNLEKFKIVNIVKL